MTTRLTPQWTDFNAHDPGVTLSEAINFGVAELAYKLTWPIEDILTPPQFTDNAPIFFDPAAATEHPLVTEQDYRHWLLAQEGVCQTWLQQKDGRYHVVLALESDDEQEQLEQADELTQELNLKRSIGEVFLPAYVISKTPLVLNLHVTLFPETSHAQASEQLHNVVEQFIFSSSRHIEPFDNEGYPSLEKPSILSLSPLLTMLHAIKGVSDVTHFQVEKTAPDNTRDTTSSTDQAWQIAVVGYAYFAVTGIVITDYLGRTRLADAPLPDTTSAATPTIGNALGTNRDLGYQQPVLQTLPEYYQTEQATAQGLATYLTLFDDMIASQTDMIAAFYQDFSMMQSEAVEVAELREQDQGFQLENRRLDFLLAINGQSYYSYQEFSGYQGEDTERYLAEKKHFLQEIVPLMATRTQVSSLQEIIKLHSSVLFAQGEYPENGLSIIDHVLLRPLPLSQNGTYLIGDISNPFIVGYPGSYYEGVTVILPDTSYEAEFKQLLCELMPAHLKINVIDESELDAPQLELIEEFVALQDDPNQIENALRRDVANLLFSL